MNFEPTTEQRPVIDSTLPLMVVLGGAGTGKTTTACAAARAHLERQDGPDRVLFLSFSRASVSRVLQRARGVVGPWSPFVEVTTFHALAWSIVRRFGAILGHENPVLRPPAYHRLLNEPESLEYGDLIPVALKLIEASEAVRQHVERRWGLVIVDEFQDTDTFQARLVEAVSPRSRRILLGDPNQCIYTFRSADGVHPERINEAAREAGPDGVVTLPPASHRDPTGLIPAIAEAIMRRAFEHDAIHTGLRTGRLVVESEIDSQHEAETVAARVRALTEDGLSVGVYCHHNDMLASLSDGLNEEDIDHDIAGLSDAMSLALLAQVEMCRYAQGQSPWSDVVQSLAVFVASAQKGSHVPRLARDIMEGGGSTILQARLTDIQDSLTDASMDSAAKIARLAHSNIGLPSKSRAWNQAGKLLVPMVARAKRSRGDRGGVLALAREAERAASGLLTDVADDPGEVQLMNLHQTKGREADATIVVLRATDFFGNREQPPYVNTSRLLYVVFSRARYRVVLLLVGHGHPAQVAPLTRLSSMKPNTD